MVGCNEKSHPSGFEQLSMALLTGTVSKTYFPVKLSTLSGHNSSTLLSTLENKNKTPFESRVQKHPSLGRYYRFLLLPRFVVYK
jgi:hypothetical protein